MSPALSYSHTSPDLAIPGSSLRVRGRSVARPCTSGAIRGDPGSTPEVLKCLKHPGDPGRSGEDARPWLIRACPWLVRGSSGMFGARPWLIRGHPWLVRGWTMANPWLIRGRRGSSGAHPAWSGMVRGLLAWSEGLNPWLVRDSSGEVWLKRGQKTTKYPGPPPDGPGSQSVAHPGTHPGKCDCSFNRLTNHSILNTDHLHCFQCFWPTSHPFGITLFISSAGLATSPAPVTHNNKRSLGDLDPPTVDHNIWNTYPHHCGPYK